MKDYDFQVGDKVTCLLFGEGVVVRIDSDPKDIFPIWVEFEHENELSYTLDGYYNSEGKKHRHLYHGHNLEIDIQEELPIRYPWINIYMNSSGVPSFGRGRFLSKKEAMDAVARPTSTYIRTIQLKPMYTNDKV